LVLLVFLAVNWLVAPVVMPDTNDRITIPYTAFKEQVQAGNVADITTRAEAVQGTFKNPVTWPPLGDGQKSSVHFDTRVPTFLDPGLETLLEQQGKIESGDVKIAGREFRGRFQPVRDAVGPPVQVGIFEDRSKLAGSISNRRLLIGAILGFIALFAGKLVLLDNRLQALTSILTPIHNSNVWLMLPLLAGTASVVSAVTAWVTLRFYLKV